jgi:hypothetical protein
MTFLELKQEEHFTALRYRTTWEYDYEYMLLFFDRLIQTDLEEPLQYAMCGDHDQRFSIAEELAEAENDLLKCKTLAVEKNFISIAGHSVTADCDLRITMFNHTDYVEVEIMGRTDRFLRKGEHELDRYMDSLEILAYIEGSKPVKKEETVQA